MKLSEAIRLGAMLKPQAFGVLQANGKTCALGAALDAISELRNSTTIEEWPKQWDWIAGRTWICPQCGYREMAHGIIGHINDQHRWTRERIADWVKAIEPKEVAPAVEMESSMELIEG